MNCFTCNRPVESNGVEIEVKNLGQNYLFCHECALAPLSAMAMDKTFVGCIFGGEVFVRSSVDLEDLKAIREVIDAGITAMEKGENPNVRNEFRL